VEAVAVECGGGWLAACDRRERCFWQDFFGHSFRISAASGRLGCLLL
jgi:hypothetical protein